MADAVVHDIESTDAAVMVSVRNLAGSVLTSVTPMPDSVAELKHAIETQIGMPRALQKLIKFDDAQVYDDDDKLEANSLDVVLIKDETPLWTWDIASNPAQASLQGEGGIIKCPRLSRDYCNVITQEPMRSGVHYFEFVMHFIGDEQSCGVVADPSQVGHSPGLRGLKAWAYYPGRVRYRGSVGDIRDGKGALHANGRAVKEFASLKEEGDVIGMLVDLDQGAIAFDLNGELQGACEIPKVPLWVITHVDTARDHVELRKPCLDDAPPANLDALRGSLLDVTQGLTLRGY